jgi:hypothetical protein
MAANPPLGAIPWLRRAHIVNLSTRYSFTPHPEEGLRDYLADIDYPGDDELHVLNLLRVPGAHL